MLLLCVSSTDSCRSLLSQPRWIALLLGLLRLGPPYAQRRALRLLRRLLPHCDPESLAEKDDGGGGGGVQAADDADWSIVTIVKESEAGAVSSSSAAAAAGSEEDPGNGDGTGDGSSSAKMTSMAGGGGGETAAVDGRMPGAGRPGGPSPMVRVTSLSNSVHTDLIPARSLLCFFLDAIGGSYQASPRPEWLGDPEADRNSSSANGSGGGGAGDQRAAEGTLRDLRSWYRGQAAAGSSSSGGREQGRGAWAFSQLEAPLVCESVSLLRTLLQTPGWGDVTATLLQDAFQRGNSCLRLLAREAADKAEAAACDAPAVVPGSAGTQAAAGAGVGPTADGRGAAAESSAGTGAATGGPADSENAEAATPAVVPPAVVTATPATTKPPLPSTSAAAEAAGRAPLAGASAPPSTTGTLLRTLGALSVLGGHVDVLYPGASAEIMPMDYASRTSGGGSRSGRSSQGSSGWGARVGRSVFGLSGLERAANAAGGGDGRGRGGSGGWGASVGGSSSASGAAGGGRRCVVVSLNLAEMHAEVLLEGEGGSGGAVGGGSSGGSGGGGGGNGGGDARKSRVVSLDCLQAVPNVPVRPGTLPPGLAQRILETLTLWCLDKGLNAAFSERLSPTAIPFVPTPAAAGSPRRVGGSRRGDGLAGVLSTAVLDRHLLLGLVRCQAAKAAQTLLLHPQTASDFVKSASAPAPGRKAKGGAGAVLLEVASGVSSSAGLGDIGAMEELVAMLLSHWQFSVLDGRSKKIQEAR